jgi:hypothetical protein
MTKRTKASITISRTIQLQPYTPYKIEITTDIENAEGLNWDDIDKEEKYLQDYVDACVNDTITELDTSFNGMK